MTRENPFSNLAFEDFRRMAKDESLSKYERIGFPDSYRSGFEEKIFFDIQRKLTKLGNAGGHVLDIGPGCSDLPKMLIDLCREKRHHLTFVDSAEMLAHLPDDAHVTKVAAQYPDCQDLIDELRGKVSAILCYSVLQYVFIEGAFFRFLDISLSLLAPGGQMLIGDIPNQSKRKRFFASATGAAFHQGFMNTDEVPIVQFNQIEHDQIDDAVVMALVQRARLQGFDAYVVPQDGALPMANRREDILIVRP